MRITIERIRLAVVVAGGLLIAALVVFLTIGRWKAPFDKKDLPKKLGLDIRQEANGFTYAEARAGKATFKISAARFQQLKNDHVKLNGVKIEMFDAKGTSSDRIEGDEFEYDQKAGLARAEGPVEITLVKPESALQAAPRQPGTAPPVLATQLASQAGVIHVKTSGLTFDQKSGVATTSKDVMFSTAKFAGRAVGAAYDSQQGRLVLDHAVHLESQRNGSELTVDARHGEFDRDDSLAHLQSVTTAFGGGEASGEEVTLTFRADGSAERLDVMKGFALKTASEGHIASPAGTLWLDEKNQPVHGRLQDGVTLDAARDGRITHGESATAELDFVRGVLHNARLERGVHIAMDENRGTGRDAVQARRTWSSPAADLVLRAAGHGALELASLHGVGGVTVTSETRRGQGPMQPAQFVADDVTGSFGAQSALQAMTGIGHARMMQTNEAGTWQTTAGDRLDVRFKQETGGNKALANSMGAGQVASAAVVGHVALVQQLAGKPGKAAVAPMQAMAARADYDGDAQRLRLTGSPRVENGELQLTADALDILQGSGDALAHGNVKASWLGGAPAAGGQNRTLALGGNGPVHVVAAEALLHQETGEAAFRGKARLWQDANAIDAPAIRLNRKQQTLAAETANAATPVRVVLVSTRGASGGDRKQVGPSVIRLTGGNLDYAEATRTAVMRGGVVGTVVADTGDATTRSDTVEVAFAGDRANGTKRPADGVNRMTARGHVQIQAQDRRGWGEQLAYTGDTGVYTLTGTAQNPPRMTDPEHGTVSGAALIFDTRDDSVKVDGGGQATTTEAHVPKRP